MDMWEEILAPLVPMGDLATGPKLPAPPPAVPRSGNPASGWQGKNFLIRLNLGFLGSHCENRSMSCEFLIDVIYINEGGLGSGRCQEMPLHAGSTRRTLPLNISAISESFAAVHVKFDDRPSSNKRPCFMLR